jgi:hypothetical protein
MSVRRSWIGLVSALVLAACDPASPSPDAGPSLDASGLDALGRDAPALDAPALDAPSLDASGLDAPPSAMGTSLRFFGHGRDAVDRVVIPIDGPARRADVGEGDLTIELFVRMRPGDNPATGCRPANDGWIEGHTLLDRDVYGSGDAGDFGLSIFSGVVAFGLARGDAGIGLCSAARIDDDRWHHVAVTRDGTTGEVVLWIDGSRDAATTGPTGDLRYRDGRTSDWPFDPTLVLGAEKHDAGDAYPSFSGWLDELRLSTSVRYRAPFTPPTTPFTPDADAAALYHLDEGVGLDVRDATGGGSDGTLRVGGDPAGPAWSADQPFG